MSEKEKIEIPVKKHDGHKWGDLSVFGPAHSICGEKVKEVNNKYSFAGQHRVRLYKFTKNVHWQIPVGVEVDISSVAQPPRRQQDRN